MTNPAARGASRDALAARDALVPRDALAPRDVLVVGAGLAATQAVAALRDRGFTGRITVLGAEGVPPYDRPPLSKHLLDRPTPTALADEVGVDVTAMADEVLLDSPARSLAFVAGRPRVTTDAAVHDADALVVATGAHAVRPPGWDAALTLHTADDAAALRAALVPGARLVVIGAGWIGAEVAGVAAAAGVDVTVVEALSAPLAGALGPQVGALAAPWYAAAGVRLVLGARVVEVRADGITLGDGTRLGADVVLAAIGARPTTAWLGAALPREADGSLRVDEGYAPLGGPRSVRAVGDVARRRSARHGWVPGGHWDGALRGPQVAVDDLLGHLGERPDLAPYVFSTQLGHELALFGLPHAGSRVVLRGTPDEGGWAALWFAGDRLDALLTVDRPRDVGAARRLFSGAALPRLDATLAADPARALREAVLA